MNGTMLGSYVKTSGRNLLRNKLFSFINIFGLAVSMSVGLLLIAFLLDLRSYDRFHENGDRICRITNVFSSNNETGGKFATTSIKTGRLLRDRVPGIEEVTTLRNNFSGDAKVGENTLPVQGYWAEPSLFRVFTFPMLQGNAATALEAPYSIMLTETAARKLFGDHNALGKTVVVNADAYQVTGVMKDVPFFSHIHFEALVSLTTDLRLHQLEPGFADWTNMWSHTTYILPSKGADMAAIRKRLNALAAEENLADPDTRIQLELLPLFNIVVGENLRQSEGGPGFSGPHLSPAVIWIFGALAIVVVLSACFNYTNLSIARAMRRVKEIGLRKAIGAGRHQVRMQFLAEAVMISGIALVLSFGLFLILRPLLINMAPEMQRLVQLNLTPAMVAAFIGFAVAVGIAAGLLPAVFFSKVSAVNAFGNASPVKTFKHLTFRRALVVVQYTVTLALITATAIGYVQYKNILAFDLGYDTTNILNINMLDNKPDAMIQALGEMPEVKGVARSLVTTGVGNAWGGNMKYRNMRDSALVMTNHVDEHYLPLHDYQLLAGGNFTARPATAAAVSEVIVNRQVLKRFHIGGGDPHRAVGEQITLNGRTLTIVGVMQDFHYGTVDNRIGPVAFTFWTPEDRAIVSARVQSADMPATMARIEAAWKKSDPVHPFTASFYDEEIEEAYSQYSTMIKIIGFLSLLAVSIASTGLLGMVVFTTETRLKEIGIRKVMGAGAGGLVLLLSRGFLTLLSISAAIALPATYLFFNIFILPKFPYHTPVQPAELFAGLLLVLGIAIGMIGSQTLKAAGSNPVMVLKQD